MNASEQMRQVLSAAPGVQAITQTIRPLKLSQADTVPAIVYQIITTNPTASLQGDTGNLDRVRLQIDCWAMDYGTAHDLADAVRNGLRPRVLAAALDLVKDGEPQQRVPRSSFLVARFINRSFDYNDTTRRHVCRSEFYLWQRPQPQE